jgi:hypothetical protein
MMIQKSGAQTSRSRKEESPLKPWHIALIALAVIVVLWQAFGYVSEQRRQNDAKYDAGAPGIPAPPGSTRAQQELEK